MIILSKLKKKNKDNDNDNNNKKKQNMDFICYYTEYLFFKTNTYTYKLLELVWVNPKHLSQLRRYK